MLEMFETIVVVAGCQRSGTTLTGQILGAHPRAFLIDEPDGLYPWFDALIANPARAAELWDDVLAAANMKYRPGQERILVGPDGRRRPAPGLTHLVLKAPNLTYAYDELARLGKVRVVYPVRDPRSVVASMTGLPGIPMVAKQRELISRRPTLATELADELAQLGAGHVPDHVKRAIVWRIKSGLGDRFALRGVPVLRFRYEDLIADPAGCCKRMASHAGLDFDEALLAHDDIYQGFGPDRTSRSRPIDGESLDRWSRKLSPAQQNDVLREAAGLMKLFGYTAAGLLPEPVASPPVADAVLRSPILLTGRGGSGTRLLSDIALGCGVFLGNRCNATGDSVEWVDLIYELAMRNMAGPRKGDPPPDGGWERFLLDKARDILGEGRWRQGQRWGFKLPETMTVVEDLFETFREARLVHLVRHPVDSALRRTHMTSRTSNPMGRAVMAAAYSYAGRDVSEIAIDAEHMHNAVTWLYQVKRVAEFGRTLPAERYLEVRFEDLCAEPLKIQARIADFVGATSRPMTDLHIEASRMRAYQLPDPRVDEVWALCGQAAAELGYAQVA